LTDAAFEVDEFSGTLGRWRATVAHEATHVLLHARLFDLNADQQTLFASEAADETPLVKCLKRDGSFAGPAVDPREYQANLGMAALLMPRSVFTSVARSLLDAAGAYGSIVEQLARRFAVSRQATRIRLAGLGFAMENPSPGLFAR
jgi:Zn-dependent peptidase ImmA (M78 family)